MSDDAQLAQRLSQLCDICEERPRNAGYLLCHICYQQVRQDDDDEDDDDEEDYEEYSDVPPEDASYEDLLEWCKRRDKDEEADLLRSTLCDNLPTHKCGKEEKGQCSICMDNYKVRQTMITLPCFHTFHETCCRQWIAEKAVCPVCMTEVKAS